MDKLFQILPFVLKFMPMYYYFLEIFTSERFKKHGLWRLIFIYKSFAFTVFQLPQEFKLIPLLIPK